MHDSCGICMHAASYPPVSLCNIEEVLSLTNTTDELGPGMIANLVQFFLRTLHTPFSCTHNYVQKPSILYVIVVLKLLHVVNECNILIVKLVMWIKKVATVVGS